jgi:hypothetical protein
MPTTQLSTTDQQHNHKYRMVSLLDHTKRTASNMEATHKRQQHQTRSTNRQMP